MRIDGFEAPIDLVASRTSSDDEIVVDFDGTSGVSTFCINCPLCSTEAYTTFGVRSPVGPGLPNNAGSLPHIQVKAPPGTIVNPPHPSTSLPHSPLRPPPPAYDVVSSDQRTTNQYTANAT